MADQRAPAGQDRGSEGRGRLARGCHEAAIGAGHGEAHERPTARPRVIEDGAHDELGLGRQPGIQVAAARVGLDERRVGQEGAQPRHRIHAGRAGDTRLGPGGRAGGTRGRPRGRAGGTRRRPRHRAVEEPGRHGRRGLAGRACHGAEIERQLQATALPRRPGGGSLADAAGHRGGQHGLLVAGVDGRARQTIDEGAELVLAEEADDLRAVIVTEAGTVEVQRDGRQAVDGHQLPPEQHVLAVFLELVAQLVRPDLVEARVETLQGGEVHEQLGGRLVTHAGDAGDVVRRVALERLEVDHLGRVEAIALVDAGRVVDDRRLDAQAGRHELGLLGDQLQHVQVARDDDGLQVAQLRLPRERADEVVRFVAGHLVDGDAEGGQRLADDGELVAQVVRRGPARGLVALVAVGTEGAAHVEAAQDMVGLHVGEAAQDDGPEAEGSVDELAFAGGQRRLEQREVGPIDEAVSVEEHEPFHCPRV